MQTLPMALDETHSERFEQFHNAHPEVYTQLVRMSRQWVFAGNRKLGIATLFERLRWEWHMNGLTDRDGFKLNNNYKAHYARKIMAENRDLDGLFNIREMRSVALDEVAA